MIPSRTRTGAVDLVLCRIGPWQDGFSGVERYSAEGPILQLLIRRELGLRPGPRLDQAASRQILEVDDLDGDDENDLALPLPASAPDGGILFVSSRDLQTIARARIPDGQDLPGPKTCNGATWIPAGPGRNAGLVFTWFTGNGQETRWGYVEPGK